MCKELGSSHAYLLPGPPVTWPPAQLTEVVSFAREIVRHKYNGGHKNQRTALTSCAAAASSVTPTASSGASSSRLFRTGGHWKTC
ncbi:hypothetical protein CHLRE_08g373375v5 [Chlamydomonas reinhardtii]|uniref:Uncharacterized protein n=1 Tax=Chlamydomonas reinhardtii TaxID=3055 RepID=A0A2K3DHG2_CHLRE|nr:uncharacterized protein CHLRE_08g373375v5 [Chlamydomonas reinhardtii]PNW79983.1 hypothetical protein CHLRE_08g373375v5 [Chlamydomonas reinhardtii]